MESARGAPDEFVAFVLPFMLRVMELTAKRDGEPPWSDSVWPSWCRGDGHGIGGSTPYLGDEVQTVLFGGFEIGQPALLRFYTLHVLGLPLLAAIMMAVHFWRIRRDGGMARPL